MDIFSIFTIYLQKSGFITYLVLIWLSAYFILTFWIGLSRYLQLSYWISNERSALDALLMGSSDLRPNSALYKCYKSGNPNAKLLNICKLKAEKKATQGLTMLSMIASTSPFVGLFGTVVSILESFSTLGESGNASLAVIAPVISEALVATAAGILVAIPSYSIHLLLKRQGYTLVSYIQSEIEYLTSRNNG